MRILAFESSCDETAVSLIEMVPNQAPTIIFEAISSQIKLHAEYGGVVPELAAREHQKNLPLLYQQLCESSDLRENPPDLIAVTTQPGLKGCLIMGAAFVNGLALSFDCPVVGVDHLEAHLLAVFIENQPTFPYLTLLVSGGHTQIVAVRAIGDYQVVSRTIDDAAGEAFDKAAAMLGIAYPGGAELARLADSAEQPAHFKLPEIMPGKANFSFSGLKTAIYLKLGQQKVTQETLPALAATIQSAIVDQLADKLALAVAKTGIGQIVLTGGVAANVCLRQRLCAAYEQVYFPRQIHCMDNATMIAVAAALRHNAGLQQLAINQVAARSDLENILNAS